MLALISAADPVDNCKLTWRSKPRKQGLFREDQTAVGEKFCRQSQRQNSVNEVPKW